MELPQSLLAEIIGHMDAVASSRSADQRRARRVRLTIQTSLLRLDGWIANARTLVRVREISATGISILHNTRMRPSDEFVLRLPRHHGQPVLVRYSVVRTQQVAENIFVIGAKVCGIDAGHIPSHIKAA